MNYNELRKRHPVFYYHDYEIIEEENEIQVRFDFEIEGLSYFNPSFLLRKPADSDGIAELELFREAAFSLGLAELVSYWKLTCAPTVVIEAGYLEEEQIRWWKKLYFNGLRDFFRTNGILTDAESFMDLRSAGSSIGGRPDIRTYHGNLIPVGGGRDSFVSMEVLSSMKQENHAFVINYVMSAIHSAEAAGYRGDRLIVAERTLDARMLDFNKQGYLNGTTPFNALTAFAAYLTAVVWGKKYICLSIEAGSDEDDGDDALSQMYSKTIGFEKDFHSYTETYLSRMISCFSLLRPLSELQITGIFSNYRQYHRVFRSCNVGAKTETWCAHCGRCLYVGVMLSAFLDDEQLNAIFGRDMLNDPDMMSLFEQQTGMCEGQPQGLPGSSREEINTAVCMSVKAHQKAGKELPLLYRQYISTPNYEYYRDRTGILKAWNDDNLVPEEYRKLVREKLEEIHYGYESMD
ncbi:MAG: hypothetical protein IIZ57_04440 [Solobacterium sp.]|nr:hypothetical protein [Solobacterium sp.]